MEVKKVQNSAEWNSENLPFSQSWEWGEILINEGKKVERLAIFDGNRRVAQAQVAFLPFLFSWTYAFCAKGPFLAKSYDVEKESVLTLLTEYCKAKNAVFLRLEPDFSINSQVARKTIDINPRASVFLDLTKNEEELLDGMHAKTRYNIRLAGRKDTKPVWEKNLRIFLELMEETGRRDKFRLHSREHYKIILDSSLSSQLIIYYGNKPVATGVFIASGDTFTYLFGASSHEYRNLMSTYLVQWLAIQKGKELGYAKYDFFGVAPRNDSAPDKSQVSLSENQENYVYDLNHQYAGVTRFKLGFGGVPHVDPGTFDILIDKSKYRVYQILRGVRRFF